MTAVHYHLEGFPPSSVDWNKLIPLLSPTAAALARYDGTLSAIPNAAVLLSPLTMQEAVLSSRIEGTQATMGDVLKFEADTRSPHLSAGHQNDIFEILNYRAAIRNAENLLETLPLSQRVVKETHKVLLQGVRGEGKSPGNYRRVPNWIGKPGGTIDEARFVPIRADRLPDAMDIWEKYIHADAPDKLVQIAILHAEFEAIHPFLDGNGRLGRILIPLLLWRYDLIQRPIFYLSGFLEANRDEYYERLLDVSRHGNWTDWCIFFLKAVKTQAEENQHKAANILQLYEQMKHKVVELTRSQYAVRTVDWIFERPIFNSTDFIADSGISESTARRILPLLRNANILRTLQEAGGQRPAIWCFPALLNIAEGRDAF